MQPRQQSWPRAWLMTDERMGDQLWDAIGRLPRGAGVVVRHYSLGPRAREELAARIALAADRRGIIFAIARDAELAELLRAPLVHNPTAPTDLPFSRSVHCVQDALDARAERAALVFVSPVFATRSHPGQEPLGLRLATSIARAAAVPAIGLGGVTSEEFAPLEREGFYGWAGIDAWLAR